MLRVQILAVVVSIVLALVFCLMRAKRLRFHKWLVTALVANAAFAGVGIFRLESDGEITIAWTLYLLLLAVVTGAGWIICSIAMLMRRRSNRGMNDP